MYIKISSESEQLLDEIINNKENRIDYLCEKYNSPSEEERAIVRGCLKELSDKGMIEVRYADQGPYIVEILKDGYLYEKHLNEEKTPFEKKIKELLERTKTIKSPVNVSTGGISIDDHNAPAEEWMNDVQIFHDKYLKNHPLSHRIRDLLFHRGLGAYKELIACLKSISKDEDFINSINEGNMVSIPAYRAKSLPEYDVFVSHANADKEEIVEQLFESLKKLGVKIFYDKDSIQWGDNWKNRILEGTKKSEFAIIVISNNFFGREWTEIELKEFLNRQNRSGQKIILPILHNITTEDLKNKYPTIADIQALSTQKISCDGIALLFAKEFIKRLKDI